MFFYLYMLFNYSFQNKCHPCRNVEAQQILPPLKQGEMLLPVVYPAETAKTKGVAVQHRNVFPRLHLKPVI